uniref:Putative secreted protein n=1 Tax=Amblyomma cajennense TaxID=34607 RepID=A0A023FDS4_AMBCJ
MKATLACLLVLAVLIVIAEAINFPEDFVQRSKGKPFSASQCRRKSCTGKMSGNSCGRRCECRYRNLSIERGGAPGNSRRKLVCVPKNKPPKPGRWPPNPVAQPRQA